MIDTFENFDDNSIPVNETGILGIIFYIEFIKKRMKNLLGGLAGAVALNILHEAYRRFDAKAPRIELIGEEALSKIIKHAGGQPPSGDRLYAATLAADIISNTLYYSLVGMGDKKKLLLRAALLGAAAGIGALMLSKPLGLSDAPVSRTNKTKALTVTWYFTGGLVSAFVIRALKR